MNWHAFTTCSIGKRHLWPNPRQQNNKCKFQLSLPVLHNFRSEKEPAANLKGTENIESIIFHVFTIINRKTAPAAALGRDKNDFTGLH